MLSSESREAMYCAEMVEVFPHVSFPKYDIFSAANVDCEEHERITNDQIVNGKTRDITPARAQKRI